MKLRLAASLAAYTAAILAANIMTANLGQVPVGLGFTVTAGTFAAGFALLARDLVHRHGGLKWALAGIAAGAVLSWVLATPALAIASTVAFAGAELVDLAIFAPTRQRYGFAAGAIASNIISAPLDTALFLHLAGFGATPEAVAGQFIAKVLWATILPLALYAIGRRALLRQPIHGRGA
jgi:queuosine precursor transporter